MVKHTQTIRRQFVEELFERVWLFCGVGAENVKTVKMLIVDLTVTVFQIYIVKYYCYIFTHNNQQNYFEAF